jgi:UDP-N-acetylmuramyl tripeptide synthase
MLKRIKNVYHYFLAWFGNVLYGNPSRRLTVIGVTGTKGKTSTVELIASALNACGKKTVLVSSAHIGMAQGGELNQGNTMPGRGKIQKTLKEAVNSGCSFAVLEVSSQGVVQHRHRFIEWDAGVFMNIHPEHIEDHGGFENYRNAKLDFFRYVAKSPKPNKAFFINKEDENAEYFAEATGDNKKVFFAGSFIKANYEATMAVTRYFGCDDKKVEEAIRNFHGVPGRMEVLIEEPFRVIVDYAHTPDSLEQVYKWAALPSKIDNNDKKLICVIGSAGKGKARLVASTGEGRDKWKRPKMGEVAKKYCDEVIVTNEDPYDEDPAVIMEEVATGADKPEKRALRILDRQEAIDKAISIASPGDTVIITGKGSEQYIHFENGRKLAWSEKLAVEQAMADRGKI